LDQGQDSGCAPCDEADRGLIATVELLALKIGRLSSSGQPN